MRQTVPVGDLNDGPPADEGAGGEVRAGDGMADRVLSALGVGVAIVDVGSSRVRLDPIARDLFGVTAPGEVSVDVALARLHDDDRRRMLGQREAVIGHLGEDPLEIEVRVVQPDGGVRWLRLLGRPVLGDDGRVVGVESFVRDVTERRAALDQLREADERHTFLLELSDAFRPLRDPVALGEVCVTMLARHLGVDRVCHARVDETTGELVVASIHAAQGDAPRRGDRLDAEQWLPPLVGGGRVLVVDDAAADPRLAGASGSRLLAGPGGALLVAPVVRGGRLVGLLAVAEPGPRPWSHPQVTLVAEVVDRLWTAAEHARTDRDGEARLVSIIDTAADCIIVIDAQGTIQLANRATAATFGYQPGELVGRNVALLMSELDKVDHDFHLDNYLKTGQGPTIGVAREVVGQHRNGSTIPLDLAVTQWTDSHGVTYYTGILRDITQRKQQTEALARARKLEAAGQLAGGVAHDLNNLLTIVGGNLELAEERVHEPATRRLLSRALEAVRRGVSFNNRLLSLVHDRQRNVQPLLLGGRLDEIGFMLEPMLGAGVRLDLDVDPGLWPVAVDPGELDSALFNLATNSRDAMPAGGTLGLSARNASLTQADLPDPSAPAGDYVVVSVSDTGTGMAPEVVGRATDPFFTTKPGGHGTGLGLASVASFVHGAGGVMDIRSAPSAGTTVTLYLPRGADVPPAASPRSGLTPAPGRGRRVLVVDDDNLVLQTTAATVESLGYEVVTAPDGTVAMARLDGDPRIELVLTDIVMPGLNGRDLAQWIGEHHPGVAIVLCSGYDSKRPATEIGLDVPFLAKPYTRSELARTIDLLLGTGDGADPVGAG